VATLVLTDIPDDVIRELESSALARNIPLERVAMERLATRRLRIEPRVRTPDEVEELDRSAAALRAKCVGETSDELIRQARDEWQQ